MSCGPNANPSLTITSSRADRLAASSRRRASLVRPAVQTTSDAAGKILQFFLLFLRGTAEGSQVRNLIFAESLNGFSRGEVRRTDQRTRAT